MRAQLEGRLVASSGKRGAPGAPVLSDPIAPQVPVQTPVTPTVGLGVPRIAACGFVPARLPPTSRWTRIAVITAQAPMPSTNKATKAQENNFIRAAGEAFEAIAAQFPVFRLSKQKETITGGAPLNFLKG